jgi:hypothetical protein
MITLSCPLCGSPVKAPRAVPHVPLVCRKCHSPFHLDRSLRPVVGSPPDVERDVDELKQKVRQELKKFPARKVAIGLGAVLVLFMTVSYVLRPADSLKSAAERAARAFADNDVDYLKSIAVSGTEGDVARWYEQTHPMLVEHRGRWHGRPEVIEVGLAGEDAAHTRGSSSFSIHPGAGNARDVSLANPDQSTEAAAAAFEAHMDWALGRGGHWELNGRETYAKAHPPAPPPPPPAPEPPPAPKKKR